MYISPKPKKNSNARVLSIRSTYEDRKSSFGSVFVEKESFELFKTKSCSTEVFTLPLFDIDDSTKGSYTISNSSKFFVKQPDSLFNGRKQNFFKEYENELSNNSCNDEILSIINDAYSTKSPISSRDDVDSQVNIALSEVGLEEYIKKRKMTSFFEKRPENPFYKNFEQSNKKAESSLNISSISNLFHNKINRELIYNKDDQDNMVDLTNLDKSIEVNIIETILIDSSQSNKANNIDELKIYSKKTLYDLFIEVTA